VASYVSRPMDGALQAIEQTLHRGVNVPVAQSL
jgi:hypothetical protein